MLLCMSLILIHMSYCFVYIILLFQSLCYETRVVVLINKVIIIGGNGHIRDALPVKEVVGGLAVRYQIRIDYNIYFYDFQQNAFPRKCFSAKGFSTKSFQRNTFHKIQEKHDEEKARNPGLIILSLGHYCKAATT